MKPHECSHKGALRIALDWACDLLRENTELRKIKTIAAAQRAFEAVEDLAKIREAGKP